MFKLLKRQNTPQSPPPGGYDADTCRRLLSEHLDYITKVCEKAATNSESCSVESLVGEGGHNYLLERAGQLDKDELFIQVIDHLKEDDFRRLREFRGNSSITTYITAIISRLVVDIVRSRTGRNRSRERAERFGEVGRRLYQIVIQRGYTLNDATEILQTSYGISSTREELQIMLEEMRGRTVRFQSDTETETAWNGSGEFVAIQRSTPEDAVSGKEQELLRREFLKQVLDSMSAEEKVIIRLRFPLDETEEPLETGAISRMLGITVQEVERRTRRLLTSCRELLLKQGISLDALL